MATDIFKFVVRDEETRQIIAGFTTSTAANSYAGDLYFKTGRTYTVGPNDRQSRSTKSSN
jgi:tartrate dehydratase beta subunit/fumarate hydratase class I family protein